jgi:hypothetical protein
MRGAGGDTFTELAVCANAVALFLDWAMRATDRSPWNAGPIASAPTAENPGIPEEMSEDAPVPRRRHYCFLCLGSPVEFFEKLDEVEKSICA